MTICKWCRRTEAEHGGFDEQKRPMRWCRLSNNGHFLYPGHGWIPNEFTPDLTPTGKLIAAALRDAEEIRAAKRDHPDLVPVEDREQWRMSPEYGQALIEIHREEADRDE